MTPQDQAHVKDADLDPMSRTPLYGIGKVPLLVGADATAVQEKDGLVQKDASGGYEDKAAAPH
ncbi:hypothetical protein BHM03_00037986 [Ensete ventricosum]|nr:hypothetical protein BHM03_00037986 [Ensete ventricosum]